jgi:hypothetical protein
MEEGTMEYHTSGPGKTVTATLYVPDGRHFTNIHLPVEYEGLHPPDVSYSYTLRVEPPETNEEAEAFESFLSEHPPVHAIDMSQWGSRYSHEELEAVLKKLQDGQPNHPMRSLSIILNRDCDADAYATSAASLSQVSPFGTGGVRSLTYAPVILKASPADSECLASEDLAKACEGIEALKIDVARTGDLPKVAHLPQSLKRLTLQYPMGGCSDRDYAQKIFDCIQTTGKGKSLVVEVVNLGEDEDDSELKALNKKLEYLRLRCH